MKINRNPILPAISTATAALIVSISLASGQDNPPPRPQGGDGQRQGFRLPPNPIVEAIDTNKDGELSAEEIAKAAEALLTLDANKDGKLSGDELRPPRGAGFGGQGGPGGQGGFNLVESVMENDANKDGKVTKEELPERMQRMLERGDTNSDGALDRQELEAMAQRFRPRGEGAGPQGGGQGGDRPRRPAAEE